MRHVGKLHCFQLLFCVINKRIDAEQERVEVHAETSSFILCAVRTVRLRDPCQRFDHGTIQYLELGEPFYPAVDLHFKEIHILDAQEDLSVVERMRNQ